MPRPLSSCPLGTLVKATQTKYNNTPIVWMIGHQTANRTKLITERAICFKCFDAQEYVAPDENGQVPVYGSNSDYFYSNIDQWLNSGQADWYSARHGGDRPPTFDYVRGNPYKDEAGFLTYFDPELLAALQECSVTSVSAKRGRIQETRKVYLLSDREITGGGNAEGEQWDYFRSHSNVAYPTNEAVAASQLKNEYHIAVGKPCFWSTRSYGGTSLYNKNFHKYINTGVDYGDGGTIHAAMGPAWGGYGVRPAIELSSDVLVADSPDTDGVYEIVWNQPPSKPLTISHGIPQAGKTLEISTEGSIDPDGDAVSYVWERRIDTGAYTQIGITTDKTVTDTVPTTGSTYQARVKAVDSNGAESAYTTGNAVEINYNTDPVISGSDTTLSASRIPISYSYTVTDSDTDQTLTVTETVDDGAGAMLLRSYTAESGVSQKAQFSKAQWSRLTPGEHKLYIDADDGAGGHARRTVTFSRSSEKIGVCRIVTLSEPVSKVFLSVYPSEQPLDATLHCEVSVNAAGNPNQFVEWEDMTAAVNKSVYTITATPDTSRPCLGYRISITPGESGEEVELRQVRLRFQ